MGVATVTFLFTDLVGSTAFAERVGPVAADRVRQDHFAALRAAVDSHGGSEVKSTGDGLMVAFTSPSEAVSCAASMQVANRRLGGGAEAAQSMRIGVSVGEATSEGDDWFGMPVVRAARLCDAADPDQILVDQLVASLAGRAEVTFEPAADLELKGIADPVTALLLRWDDAEPTIPLPGALASAGTSLVGRADHLARLDAAWERATKGETVLGLLGGEPGAGKTSIAGELARRLHEDHAVVLFGRCRDGPGLAYQPFVQALGHLVRHADETTLRDHVAEHGGELLRLSDDLGDRLADVPPPREADPSSEQWYLFEAVLALLREAGRSTPVLLVLDDVHWSSTPTLQLLRHLLEAETPATMLIVATYRDTELARTHPLADTLAELRADSAVERVKVGGLDQEETQSLVETAAGHELSSDGRAFADQVHRRTEGNPFFVLEVLRHLVESGAIVEKDGRWAAGDVEEGGLPEGVREVVGRRLRRLPDDTNRALDVAAIVGLEFDLDITAQVLNIGADDLLDQMDEALRSGIVQEVRSGRYAFTHALIRSTVGDEAGSSRRVHLHGQVADAIETLHGDNLDPWLAELAFHHAESAHANRTAAAVDFAIRAAEQARRQAAIGEAVVILERGLEAARLAEPPNDEQLARLYIALAEATVMVSPVDAREWVVQAGAAAERAGAFSLVAEAAASLWSVFNTTVVGAVGGDRWLLELCDRAIEVATAVPPSVRSRILAMRVLLRQWLLEPLARDAADEAVRLATASGDPVARIISAQAQLNARWVNGPRREDWAEYLALMDGTTAATADPYLHGMASVFKSWGASGAGDRARFLEARDQVRQSAAVLTGPRLPTWGLWLDATEASREGDWSHAVELAAEASRQSIDPTIGQNVWALHLGNALLLQGTPEQLEAARGGAPAAASPDSTPLIRAYFAMLAAYLGDRDAALRELQVVLDRGDDDTNAISAYALASRAAGVSGAVAVAPELERRLRPFAGFMAGSMVEIASVDSLLGSLLSLQGRHDQAEPFFRSGLELEEGLCAPSLVAQTRYWWARCLIERDGPGDAEQASALLDTCLATATELGMKPLQRLAEDLRREA